MFMVESGGGNSGGKMVKIGETQGRPGKNPPRNVEEETGVSFDSVFDGVLIHDPETGAILDVNRRACEMWGFSKQEMLKMGIKDLSLDVPPFDQISGLVWIKNASYKPHVFEWRCKDHAGRPFWAEINIRSDTVKGQRVVVACAHDINIRKEAELKRHHAIAGIEALFRAINDSISLLDLNGSILQANHAMCRLLACPREKIIGRKCHELFHCSSEFIPGCPMKRMIQSKHRESLELNEGDQWFLITADPMFDEKGELIGCVHVVRDISDQKRLAIEREELLEKLRAAHTEIKTLHGLLPICASCKCIRDDRGYWIQIESYIETRSEAHFSHGICPDCAKKLYPTYYTHKNQQD